MPVRARRIMVGYDGSDSARRALDAAADLAGYGSTLTVVTVQTGAVGRFEGNDARDRLGLRHIEARYLEPTGDPGEKLLAAVRELEADLVVVGRRNDNPLRLLLGSVSAKVVRRAGCDVLVVR